MNRSTFAVIGAWIVAIVLVLIISLAQHIDEHDVRALQAQIGGAK